MAIKILVMSQIHLTLCVVYRTKFRIFNLIQHRIKYFSTLIKTCKKHNLMYQLTDKLNLHIISNLEETKLFNSMQSCSFIYLDLYIMW